jgi:hypothetical protein
MEKGGSIVIQRPGKSESDSFAARDRARAAMNCQCNLFLSRLHVRLDSLLTHGRLASPLISSYCSRFAMRSAIARLIIATFSQRRPQGGGYRRWLQQLFLFAREGTGATST